MSLSLHSSTEALTSSKRGSEKESDIEPEKSSIGEISFSTSSRPPTGFSSPASIRRWNHCSWPVNHSKDWICRSSRFGTPRGSLSFANETRFGAPGIPDLELVAAVASVARETAKMRPSRDYERLSGRVSRQLTRRSRVLDAHHPSARKVGRAKTQSSQTSGDCPGVR